MIAQRIINKDRMGRNRKYSLDVDFFKKIDTEDKAYWLGFLYADGCITDKSVNILINQNDIEILEKFKKSIQYSGIIEIRNDKINYGKKYGIKISKTAKVRIGSVELREDLIKLGCFQRKTFILKFPTREQVPNHLIHHFIRGYFDGDGCVYNRKYIAKDGKLRGFVSITSTNNMLNGIKEYLINNFKINPTSINIYHRKEHKEGISILTICSINSMKIFRDFIYLDSNLYLNRKKEKFYSLNLD
jgi:hypothetical protein